MPLGRQSHAMDVFHTLPKFKSAVLEQILVDCWRTVVLVSVYLRVIAPSGKLSGTNFWHRAAVALLKYGALLGPGMPMNMV